MYVKTTTITNITTSSSPLHSWKSLSKKAKLNPSFFYPRSAVWKEQRPLIRSDLRRFEEFANTAPFPFLPLANWPWCRPIFHSAQQASSSLKKGRLTQHGPPPSELSPLRSVHKKQQCMQPRCMLCLPSPSPSHSLEPWQLTSFVFGLAFYHWLVLV